MCPDTIIILCITVFCIIHVTLEYICYDDGCHLKKYAINPQRSQSTETANSVSQLSFVIDRMHMKGHVDSWCKKTCDPSLFPDISNVS